LPQRYFGYALKNVYPERVVKVSKWGNSLALRLPARVVEALKLREGDDIEIFAADERALALARKPGREEFLAHLRKFRGILPADFKFDQEEFSER
jgi:antitoxin MazE